MQLCTDVTRKSLDLSFNAASQTILYYLMTMISDQALTLAISPDFLKNKLVCKRL